MSADQVWLRHCRMTIPWPCSGSHAPSNLPRMSLNDRNSIASAYPIGSGRRPSRKRRLPYPASGKARIVCERFNFLQTGIYAAPGDSQHGSAWSGTGRAVLLGSPTRRRRTGRGLAAWDRLAGRRGKRRDNSPSGTARVSPRGHGGSGPGRLPSLAFSRDGKRLAWEEQIARVWDSERRVCHAPAGSRWVLGIPSHLVPRRSPGYFRPRSHKARVPGCSRKASRCLPFFIPYASAR